ncbi:CFAP43 [Mytilus edulis]|uniref:Cilia- and flagella-associated protein 43 n=1 Tax=Mytilus edulis TaxID=6550 RepID=A0A8S3U498_MYTED|nr:CFAP43 [Mytilus edulis]
MEIEIGASQKLFNLGYVPEKQEYKSILIDKCNILKSCNIIRKEDTFYFKWAQGYNGSPARYIDKDVICYQCGSNVKFVAEDGAETVFNFKGNGVGPFAVHPNAKCFAVAEQCLNPKICIYVYPTFRELVKLEDGTQLEYHKMSFSQSEYLCTVSGVPDFELILCHSKFKICITTERSITLWQTEQSNDKYLLQPHHSKSKSITKERSLRQTEQSNDKYLLQPQKYNPLADRTINTFYSHSNCITTERSITLWQTEQSNDKYLLQPHQVSRITITLWQTEQSNDKYLLQPHHSKSKSDKQKDITFGRQNSLMINTFYSHTTVSLNLYNHRNERSITLWQTEQSNDKYLLQPQKVKLPPSEPSIYGDEDKDRDQPTRASTRMTSYTIDVPRPAIAGLVGEKAEQLEEIQDSTPRVIPLCQAWTPGGDLFIGCKGGQLMRVDGEVIKARVLYYPPLRAETPMSRATSAANSRFQSQTDLINMSRKQTKLGADDSNSMTEGSFDCIVLHKRGLYVGGQDGMLRLIDTKSEDCRVLEQCNINHPIISLSFPPSYRRLAIGSCEGSLHLYEAGIPNSLKLLKDLHWGTVMGIGCLTGNEHVVSVKEDGELQVWTMDKGKFVSSVAVGVPATCMACSPLTHVAAVGTVSGHVMIVDLTNVQKPRIIKSTRMYHVPVSNLTYDVDGNFLIAGAENGQVFVIDGRASKDFNPIGYTVVEGEILTITTFTVNGVVKVSITTNSSGNRRNGADALLYFELPEDILKDPRKSVQSLKCDFKDAAIKKMVLKFGIPSFGGAVAEGNLLFAVSQKTKKLHQISLPDEIPKKYLEAEGVERTPEFGDFDGHAEPLLPETEFPGHQLPGAKLLLSPHGKWLASYGIDGYVQVRAIGSLDRFISIRPHDYHSGGVRNIAFSDDSQSVFTTGQDGVICCYSWNYSTTGIGKAKSAMESARARKTKLMQGQKDQDEVVRKMSDWVPPLRSDRPTSAEMDQSEKVDSKIMTKMERAALEQALASDEIYRTPTPTAATNATWQDMQKLEWVKAEDAQYHDVKKDLRVQIRDMRRTIQEMLKQNETLPAIEKLGRHEFDLDIEEQNRLQTEADSEVQRVREEIEFDNLAKIYLREMIKKECWDDMKVKGRAVQAFYSNLEVSNFPMRERSKDFEKLLNTVTIRRTIELAELAARKSEIEVANRPTTTASSDENIHQDDDLGEGEDEDGEKPSTTGSLGAQYGGGSDLFYSQFDLHTREQKINQIILLEDAIHRIKVAFNKEFADIHLKKVSEIGKIKEKNKRIKKIMDDIDLDEEIILPLLSIYEEPEQLLEVKDEEVKVEKYLTPEQKKKKEEEDKMEEERRLKEKGDNARERGLGMMMGGVLEIKKEDELKKDVPKPLFMQTKELKDWTEDEKRLAGEYEQKVKDLNEEREKYRKQLETELRKLQSIIQDSMGGFDEMLTQVFMKKIKVMMVVYQEELKILRLRASLLVEEELETQEQELNRLVEHKKSLKALTAAAMIESKKHLDAYKNDYENLQYEDKAMDKTFKREFNDVTALQQDQLYRLFRRRPKIPRLKGFDTPAAPSTGDHGLPNPFADRPSTANLNLAQLKNDEARVNLNLEVQLLLKQGQVETDTSTFIADYKNSALIHRSVVEELNTNIKQTNLLFGIDDFASIDGTMDNCIFCDKLLENGEQTVKLGKKGCDNINKISSDRQQEILTVPGLTVHHDCRRDFINLKSTRWKTSVDVDTEISTPERGLRSSKPLFKFKENCLFCGQTAKNYKRKRGYDVVCVRTLEFQSSVESSCRERNDKWGEEVLSRIQMAHSDLHAADAVYHAQCNSNFRTSKQMPQTIAKTPEDNLKKRKISYAAQLLKEDIKLITSKDIFYPSAEEMESETSNADYVPRSLRIFLNSLFSEADCVTKISAIGHAIIQATRRGVL